MVFSATGYSEITNHSALETKLKERCAELEKNNEKIKEATKQTQEVERASTLKMKEEFENKVKDIRDKMISEFGESKAEENKELRAKIKDLISQWEERENEFKSQMKDFEGIFNKNDGKIFQKMEEIKKKTIEHGLVKAQIDALLKEENDLKIKIFLNDRKKTEYEASLLSTSNTIMKFSEDASGVRPKEKLVDEGVLALMSVGLRLSSSCRRSRVSK